VGSGSIRATRAIRTFKANLQQMLDTLNAAGKTAVLGKVPVASPAAEGARVSDPDQGQRNVQYIKPTTK